ncbi:MAG: type II secretion system protein [Patescibacteria group bacterium]
MSNVNKKNKGFTLVELLVAIALFITIMTVSMSSIVGILDANRKSRSLKTALSNLNLAMESMAKEMRFGTNYHCGSTGTITTPQNCAGGGTFVSFLSSDNLQITYSTTTTTLYKQVWPNYPTPPAPPFIAVTASEIIMDSVTFYTFGSDSSDTLQPKIIIRIIGHAGTIKGRSDFTLQTLVSQRFLDR